VKIAPYLLLAALLGLASALPVVGAEPNQLSKEELADGWILLFDGQTDFGWTASSKADWNVADGALSVSAGEPGLLCTTSQFGDYLLKLEFRADADTNSGVFLRTPLKPTDPKSDCYELNIAAENVSPFATGSFVGRQKASGAPTSDGWRSFEVRADGARFVVKLDGQQVLDYTDPKPLGRGHIGLQLNKGRVAFRNIKLKPLGLQSLFNGKDLTGWRVFPGEKSVYAVTPDGHLNVKDGKGQLESEAQFADFVLQLEIFSNGKHLNSGIFFRSIPGEFWNGYESQIRNEYQNGDRTKPVDFGTGAIYRRQAARKVNADDFTWFHKTLIASGPHIAVWVNGYQVTDWTDMRPAHNNPRNGLRLDKGTLIIQGHDPTTDLSFRNIEAKELPPR
jgi:hypothetical protein